MKMAPVTFLAAFGIFLVSISISESNSYLNLTETKRLDFTGIDTLEIQSNRPANIIMDNNITAMLDYSKWAGTSMVEKASVQVIKKNNKLLITAHLNNESLEIKIPTTVQHMVLIETEAFITVNESVGSLDLQTSGKTVVWDGNANALSIIDSANPEHCIDDHCYNAINIAGGVINQLHIKTLQGEVILGEADKLKAVRLSTGPHVRLSMSSAGSLKNIQYEELVSKAVRSEIGE